MSKKQHVMLACMGNLVRSASMEGLFCQLGRPRYLRQRRLVRQAADQGAAPTDHDLAEALQGSRRTIMRDMKALEQAGGVPATRRRSR